MRLGDIYKSKTSDSFICIDSFATNLNPVEKYKTDDIELFIIINQLEIIDGSIGYSPSFNKYTNQEYIEENYTLWKSTDGLNQIEFRKVYQELEELMKRLESRQEELII